MKSIKEETSLNNKRILLRLDLNVPIIGDEITDTTRIDKILPTLKFLISQNAKIIIISHVGRPKGKVVNELSLRPICKDLEMKLKQKIKLISKNVKEIVYKDLFDSFNILCPKNECSIYNKNKDLIILRDQSHLTKEASLLLKDKFEIFIKKKLLINN